MDVCDTHRPSSFFVLRSPLLPVEVLHRLFGAEDVEEASAAQAEAVGGLEALLREREQRTLSRLAAIAEGAHVREAIFVASPSLDAAIERWQRHPDADGARKTALSVLRYVARMCTRSTPFGLFSAISIGDLGGRTSLRAAPIATCRPHARIDTHLLCAVIDKLTSDEATRAAIRLVTTPSLYTCAARLRYARISLSDVATAFPLVDVTPTAPLLALLDRAREPASRAELVAAVCEGRSNVSEATARAFVDQVVEHALLVPAVTPAITGPEPARPLIAALREEPALAEVTARLEEVADGLERAGTRPIGDGRTSYEQALVAIDRLPARTERITSIQVDLARPLEERSLGPRPQAELLRVATLLRDLFPPQRSPDLKRFRHRFEERFDAQEVPLLQALDDEFGVDLAETRGTEHTELLRDLPFGHAEHAVHSWTERDAWLADRLHAALRGGATEVVIDQAPVGPPPSWPLPFPAAFAALATIHGSSAGIDAGNFTIERPAFTAPAAALLGRFCHASPELEERVRELIAAEEALARDSGVVLADVVNLTLGRMANVQLRPRLYAYEIVCHGRSCAPVDRQIPAADLLVSIVDDEIVLRSKRLGRRIVPAIPTAYNANIDAAVVYRFLHMLQFQSVGITSKWSWGAFEDCEYLPAVRSGRTVLEAQRWKLSSARLRPITEAKGLPERHRAVAALRESLRIPRWVAVVAGDNFVPLDLENPLATEVLAQAAKGTERLLLRDFSRAWLSPKALTTEGGSLLHEVVVPFLRRTSIVESATGATKPGAPVATPARAPSAPPVSNLVRSFPPGSAVLYASIYGMTSRFDELVLDVIQPLAERARAEGTITKWFFVRFVHDSDPAEHLRLRFFGGPSLWTTLLPALSEALGPALAGGSAWRLKIDTYEREVERYGGLLGVALAEDLFSADSEACVALLDLLGTIGEEPNDRWQLVALGWNALFEDFGLDLSARAELACRRAASYLDEFGGAKDLERALGRRWREVGPHVTALLTEDASDRPLIASARKIYAARSSALAPTVAAIRCGLAEGTIASSATGLLASYAHMSADRIFTSVSALRAQELVVWELLSRAYRSALARKRCDVPQ
jgi:lantibiotic biosynthesis protein